MKGIYLPALLLLAACGPGTEVQADAEAAGIYRNGRDGLCLARDGSAGLITYGTGNSNCSVTGTATRAGERLVIAPEGDERCRLEIRVEERTVTIGPRSEDCSYYCGPGADYSGRVLRRSEEGPPVTDFGGDPLC